MEVSPDELREAVESQHGGKATFVQSVPVREHFQGQPVWEGVVHVFSLEGHPQACTAYAWSHTIDGTDRRRFVTVLGIGRVDTPLNAVRAALLAQQKGG